MTNNSPLFGNNNWEMKTEPTSRLKFFFSANSLRFHQLDFVKKQGGSVMIRVLSGKECFFREGNFTLRVTKRNKSYKKKWAEVFYF